MAKKEPGAKLTIASLEAPRLVVTAMYNPKEIGVDKSVPWAKTASSIGDPPELEFSSADGRTMSFELLFDGFETGTNVHTTYIATLLRLASAIDPDGPEEKRRPPRVSVKWGVLPEFQGVIESIGTKYTMFLPDGTPVRATCHIKVREARRATFARR